VVATRVGAIPDVLNSPRAGLVVAPGSATALADGIARALPLRSDPAARNARRLVVDRFSLQRRVAEHLRIYGELLRGDAGAEGVGTTGVGGRSWNAAR
jgi:glycosyltransferase involved in cell wall biosynthesis